MLKERCFKTGLFLFCLGVVSLAFFGCHSSENGRIEPRVGFDLVRWKIEDLGKKIQTTSVHPDDSRFLTGKTTTKVEGKSKSDFSPKIGLASIIGDENLNLKIGADIRYNLLSATDGFREGFYDTRQQVSDTRLPANGSFVFTQLTPGKAAYMPFVGIEARLAEGLFWGFEIGFPYMKWEARSGHDRWGSWETVQRDSWEGFGIRYAGNLALKIHNNGELYIAPFYEEYSPDFVGEEAKIEGWGVFAGITWRL